MQRLLGFAKQASSGLQCLALENALTRVRRLRLAVTAYERGSYTVSSVSSVGLLLVACESQ